MSALPPLRLAIVARCRVAGIKLVPGQILCVPADRLRSAVGLCASGTARPADKATAVLIELHRLLR